MDFQPNMNENKNFSKTIFYYYLDISQKNFNPEFNNKLEQNLINLKSEVQLKTNLPQQDFSDYLNNMQNKLNQNNEQSKNQPEIVDLIDSSIDEQCENPNYNYNNSNNNHFNNYNPTNNIIQNPILAKNEEKPVLKNEELSTQIQPNPKPKPIKPDRHIVQAINFRIYKIHCLLHFAIFFISIILLVMGYLAQNSLKYSEGYYFSKISKNWNKQLINKITFNNCEKNDLSLLQDFWPGTVTGCACIAGVKQQQCSRKSSCRTIKSNDPLPLDFWRGIKFCKQTQNLNYLEMNIESSADKCPTGTRSCGLIDSYSNHLCISNSLNCPIINIQFFNSTSEYKPIKNDILLNFPNGLLVYSTDEKEKDINKIIIPVDFKISKDQPCRNPYYENINKQIYVLDYFYAKQICRKYTNEFENSTLFDENYVLIDGYSEENLYNENGITKVTYDLPFFRKDQYKTSTNLYYKNYFGLKNTCLKNIQKQKLSTELSNDLNIIAGFVTSENSITVLTLACLIISVTLTLLILGVVITSTNKFGEMFLIDEVASWVYCFFGTINVGMLIGYLIIFSNLISSLGNTPHFDLIFSDLECVDSYTIDLYKRFVPNLSFSKNAGIVCIIGSVVNIICHVVYTVLAFKFTSKPIYDQVKEL